MKLIADSGSTKTDWRLVKDSEVILSVQTIGLNPYHHEQESIQFVLRNELVPVLEAKEVKEVFFYGAGCSSFKKRQCVQNALMQVFSQSKIEVEHDLLGAARALCGSNPGIAAILGTGSNTCFFDGQQIVENVPALGYILGDEGSGSYIGKKLVIDFLYKEMPKKITESFNDEFGIDKDDVLQKVYKEALPNRYLASFTKWVGEHIEESYCRELVNNAFEEFFKHHVIKYKQHQEVPLNVLGSVGFYFQELLAETAQKYHVQLGKVIRTPIEELVLFHI